MAAMVPLRVPDLSPIVPSLAIIAIYYWVIYRPDLMPGWAVFLLGLIQDLLGGGPVGVHALVFLLLVATLLTTLRWILIALFVDQLWIMIFAQTLHAASFCVYHAVAIHLTHQLFTGRHQGRGQALYSSLSFGAGGAVGSLIAGYLWAGVGAQWMYAAAAATAALAGLIAWRGIERQVQS